MPRTFHHFLYFVALSLLLHLGVVLYFVNKRVDRVTPQPSSPPFFVDLREARRELPREDDVPLQPVILPRKEPARHLADEDQSVDRDSAPRGSDSRETTAVQSHPTQPGAADSHLSPIKDQTKVPALSREKLFLAARNAAKNVASDDPEINRRLQRDVEEGRAVLLDTEKDILGSFYKRFRNAVENVWDYPKGAITRGEAGICLYRIEINRAGILVHVPELLRSSGFSSLDSEAKEAVLRASPLFGFLPDSYPFETLTIFAYFDYRLGNRPSVRNVYYYR